MATLSSIITPTNITTASNTQTLTNKTITGGIYNGTVGATTASTGAFTTVNATGATTSASYVVGTGTVATSSITTNAANGMVIIGKVGTSTDFYLGQPTTTSSIMQVPTGTVNVVFGGNVGIGTTPAKKLDVNGAVAITAPGDNGCVVTQGSSGGYGFKSIAITNGGTYYHALFTQQSPTTDVGSITSTGSTTTYATTSDYRLKDITDALVNSGTFIDSLKPKTGTWKSDGSKFVGFLAHEFAEVSPTSVVGKKDAVDADGKPVYQAMQASSAEVIANLVAELQSLRKRLAALEAK